MDKYIIRNLPRIHCARGPRQCRRYRVLTAQSAWILLDIDTGDADSTSRPTTAVIVNGTLQWLVYDVARVFSDRAEAAAFARANGLSIEE